MLIKKTFSKVVHPSFENRWVTVFKFQNYISEEQIRNRLNEFKINTLTQKIGIRSIIKANVPSNIRNPSLEMALAAMRSETHIIRFKTHPTGEYRDGAICMESCNNTAHILLHCPISNFIWALAADVIKILTGIKIRLDPKLIMLNFTDNPILCKADKKIIKYVNTIFL